jgi:hypothetical protein
MGTVVIEESDVPIGVSESHQVLAENAHTDWRTIRGWKLRGQGGGYPIAT